MFRVKIDKSSASRVYNIDSYRYTRFYHYVHDNGFKIRSTPFPDTLSKCTYTGTKQNSALPKATSLLCKKNVTFFDQNRVRIKWPFFEKVIFFFIKYCSVFFFVKIFIHHKNIKWLLSALSKVEPVATRPCLAGHCMPHHCVHFNV